MTNSHDISKLTVRIAEIIIDELKLEDVTPETFDPEIDLIDEVGIDSMDLATIALVLRDEYGIVIDEDDYPKLNNIHRIAQYIQEALNEGKQG
jgi:acyl carrier protein